jgi:hypothetical protein
VGLVPGIECFGDCSNGWNYYLQHSLLSLVSTGKGQSNILEDEIKNKKENKTKSKTESNK